MDSHVFGSTTAQIEVAPEAAPSTQPLWVSGRARFPVNPPIQMARSAQGWQDAGDLSMNMAPDNLNADYRTRSQFWHDMDRRAVLFEKQRQQLERGASNPCPYDPVELTVSALEALAFEYDTGSSSSPPPSLSSSSSSSGSPLSFSTAVSTPREGAKLSPKPVRNNRKRVGQSRVLSLSAPSTARIDSILATLRAYSHNARAAEGVVALLRALAASSHAASETIGALGGADAVTAVLTSYCETDVAVAGQALMTIANLALSSFRNKQRLVQAGALRAIVLAVDAHIRRSPHVVVFGCLAVRNITEGGAANAASAILNADVTALIARVLHAANQTLDSSMALHALRAYSNIVAGSDHPEPSPLFKSQRQMEAEEPHDLAMVKIRIRSSGGLEALAESLIAFSTNAEVLEACLSAVHSVVQACPANAGKFGEVADSRGIQAMLSLIGACDDAGRVCSFVTVSQSASRSSSPSRQGSVSSSTAPITSPTSVSSSSSTIPGRLSSGTSGSGSAIAFMPDVSGRGHGHSSAVASASRVDYVGHSLSQRDMGSHMRDGNASFESVKDKPVHGSCITSEQHLASSTFEHPPFLSDQQADASRRNHAASGAAPSLPSLPSSASDTSSLPSPGNVFGRGAPSGSHTPFSEDGVTARVQNSDHTLFGEPGSCQAATASGREHARDLKPGSSCTHQRTTTGPPKPGACKDCEAVAYDAPTGNVTVLARIAEILQALTLVQSNRELITKKHGISAIVDLMRALTSSARDVPAAMLALWRCLVGSETAAAQACMSRAAPAVVQVMQRHPHRRGVQRLGLALLVVLTELNDGNRHAACSAGAVSAVYFALTEHGRSEDVVARGCRFMLLLSPLNILSSGVDLEALVRVVTLRRSRHASSALVQRAARDLVEAIEIIPGDVGKVVDQAGVACISADWMVLGKNGDLEVEFQSGRATNSGSAVSSRTTSHSSAHRGGKSSGRINFRPRRRDTILGSAQGNSGQPQDVVNMTSIAERERCSGCISSDPRPCVGGRLFSAISTRLCVRNSYATADVPSRAAMGVAVAGHSSRWRSSESCVSVSSLRSTIGSRLRGSRRRATHYSTATQYVAMRPLRSTLKDTREQEAALRTNREGESNEFSGVDRDGGELREIADGHGAPTAAPTPHTYTASSRRARSELFEGATSRVVPVISGHSFSNDATNTEQSREPDGDNRQPARPRTGGTVHMGLRRVDAEALLESRVRQLLSGDEENHTTSTSSISPTMGSRMSKAGLSHRPETSRIWPEHQVGPGSGRRGESGSLHQRAGSDSCHSSPKSDRSGAIGYHDLDHVVPST